jgi:transcriptional/translational regulatory protein YebC/TACO1
MLPKGTCTVLSRGKLLHVCERTQPHSTSPEQNAKLAMLLRKAKDLNVTKEKIEMTLKKAEGSGTGGDIVTYEALGPATKVGTPVAMIM